MKRPEIKDYFHKKTDLETVHSEYTKSPHLYSYTSALDMYIDYLEDEALKSSDASKQRELLIAFMEYIQTKQAIHFIDKNELVNEYLKNN